MHRLLLIAYHFPPVGFSGVQRSVKFVKYLPEFGWSPTVLTGPEEGTAGLPTDMTLFDEIPPGTRIARVSGPEPPPSGRWRSRAERWFRLPRKWSRWWIDGATETGTRFAGDVDVVMCSMSPFESSRAARRIAARRGVPWIADLRDPWALDQMTFFATWLHRRLERATMRRSLRSAAAVIMNTPEAARVLGSEFPELRGRIHAIPNGFDAEDFAPAVTRDEDGTFLIVHAGSFHTEAGLQRRTMRARRLLGGTHSYVNPLARSHVYLLRAVQRLIDDNPDLQNRIRLVFAGASTPADRSQSASFVDFVPYLPHSETVALIRRADLLFLPMHDIGPSRRARIVPGKTYEYIATGRPILAAVPNGDARDLVREVGTGLVCDPTDVECMARTIKEQIARTDAGETLPSADPTVVARFERRELTRRLASVLESVLEK